ncbi:MAG: hypothetical protein D3914_12010, partial [Candidatus Electrothrix sp. LOE2]|nr:hypothetical protein [Candidatus Electrothrix sp. LOE2]
MFLISGVDNRKKQRKTYQHSSFLSNHEVCRMSNVIFCVDFPEHAVTFKMNNVNLFRENSLLAGQLHRGLFSRKRKNRKELSCCFF